MTNLINCTGKFCYRHTNFQNTEAANRGVSKSFKKFAGKHLRQNLFFNIVAGLGPAISLKKTPTQVFSSELCETFKSTFFSKRLFLKIWKFIYGSGLPQLSDKWLFWKCWASIQEHICIALQVTNSIKLKIGWIHITIKIRYCKTLKISSRYGYIFQRPI